MNSVKEIESSIIKKFRKKIWGRFVRGIIDFEMITSGDKIAICISGGKDSFLLAKCLEELKKHGKIDFEIEYIIMNPGYNQINIDKIHENCRILNIKPTIFDSPIFEITEKETNPCYLCARMRRGYLYSKAQELGCNKIALGHHFDDVVETIMLNIIYTGSYKTMMPKLKSTNWRGMELIRPLYFVKEEDIIKWANHNELSFIGCACKVTQSKTDNKRAEMKELIKELNKKYKNTDINIMKSSYNIQLDAIIGYKTKDEINNFLDKY